MDKPILCVDFDGVWAALNPQKLLDFKPWNKRELGATGQHPQGQISDDDEGELRMAIGADRVNGLVRLEFGKPVAWLALPKDAAVQFANAVLKAAGGR